MDHKRIGGRKRGAQWLTAMLLLGFVLSGTGCGRGQDNLPPSQEEQNLAASASNSPDEEMKSVYMPSFTALELGAGEEPYLACLCGDSLYYVRRQYGASVEDSRRSICAYSIEQQQVIREIPVGEGYGQIVSYSVAEDGSLYVLDFASADGSSNDMVTWLRTYDPQGQSQLTINLWEDARIRTAYIAPAVDAQGRLYVPENNKVVLFEADGSPAGEISLEKSHSVVSIGKDADGSIYIGSVDRDGDCSLSEVYFEKRQLGEELKNYPNSGQTVLIPAYEGDFLVNTQEELFLYDPDTETSRSLFSWTECGIAGLSALCVAEDGEKGILAVLYEDGVGELAYLTQGEASSSTAKTELVIGTFGAGDELKRAVASFNRRSLQYHVTIRDYGSEYVPNTSAHEEAVTTLNLDLVSAHNCPDLLDLTNLSAESYARNGVLENLEPWLEQSKVLNREEYVENILEQYTYNGQLVSIPHSVSLTTLSGNRRRVGEEPGWTLEEMMECAVANPDVELFSITYSQEVLRTCMWLGKSAFLDAEQAECRFDSEDFRSLLQFAASYPKEPDHNYIGPADGIVKDKVLLNQLYYINAYQDLQMYEAMYGGEMTLIGFPTAEGEGSGCAFSSDTAYAITSRSEHKEAAWAFLEYSLGRDVKNGLPTHRKKLLEMADTTEYARDNQGFLLLGLDGMPLPQYDSINYDGWQYEYHPVTEEETAALLYLMDTAQAASPMDDTLWRIIVEEAGPYFQGQKTVEDTAAAIQSRAGVYLKENRQG